MYAMLHCYSLIDKPGKNSGQLQLHTTRPCSRNERAAATLCKPYKGWNGSNTQVCVCVPVVDKADRLGQALSGI